MMRRRSIAERDRSGARRQRAVNRLAEAGRYDEAAHLARAWADRDHAGYPQYAEHWRGWVMCKVTADLRSKGGPQAMAGDWVLVKYRPGTGGDPYSSFYSLRLGWDCSIGYGVDVARARNAYYQLAEARRARREAAYRRWVAWLDARREARA